MTMTMMTCMRARTEGAIWKNDNDDDGDEDDNDDDDNDDDDNDKENEANLYESKDRGSNVGEINH